MVSQSIMVMYRLLYQLGDRSHYETMAKLKAWHDANKRDYAKREGAIQMIIRCHDYEWFMDVCYDLLKRGAQFEADLL